MRPAAAGSFAGLLKALREAAGFTQEELATIAGLSVHAVSALERGERRRPHVETVRALSAALDLSAPARDALMSSAREPAQLAAVDELSGVPLPLAPTILVGREGDLHALRGWFADPTTRLVTLTGSGGAGKTRLALEVARAIAEGDGSARVVLVWLAAIRDPGFVAAAVAEALGLADVAAADLPKRARAACGDRATLMLLDNFEHVLDAAPLVADLLRSVSSLRVLVTSRAPLRLRGEREYLVGPLDVHVHSEAMSPADLARVPAVRLFTERVRGVRPDFCLTPANGPTVTAICRRLDALPLALELAAPCLKVLTPEELLQRLERDVLLPMVGPRDLPERQQTMNATVAWSYHLLGAHEQRAFRRFGALPGRFPLAAAAAVLAGRQAIPSTDEALDAVADLIDKSLLLRSESSVATRPLYEMLETVRAYAVLELNDAGERDNAMAGLARYCADEAALAAGGLVGPAQAEWLDRVRDDLDTYRGGLTWLIERSSAPQAAGIVRGLWFFWVIRGHATEGLRWCEQILNLSTLRSDARSRLLTPAAMMLYTRGELGRARTTVNNARTAAADAGDAEGVVQAEWGLGHIENVMGNLDVATALFARSAAGFRAAGNLWGTMSALTGLAWVALATGDLPQAESLLDDASSVPGETGSWFMLRGLYLRATLAVRRGHSDEAIRWARESLVRIRQLRDKFAFVYVLVPLAAAAVLRGEDAWAARILGARDAVTERTGTTVADSWVKDLRDMVEREAPVRLGPDRWAEAYAAGRKTSIDEMLKEIDDRSPLVES